MRAHSRFSAGLPASFSPGWGLLGGARTTVTTVLAGALVSAVVGCSPGASDAGSDGTAGAASGAAGDLGTAGNAGGSGGGNAAGASPVGGTSGAGASSATGGASGSAGAGGDSGGASAGAGAAGSGAGAGDMGGSAGTGGSAGAGGSGWEGDCNGVTGQKVVTVGASGADFQTVQAALDSLSKSNTTPTQVRIAPGTYQEKLSIQVPNITLCGQAGKAASTVLTYGDNANTPNGNGGTLGTTGSASTTLSSSDVSVENLTFANSTPLGGSQAVALLVNGDRVQFRSCRFLSFQDTLYVRKARQYFRDCYVEGTVDYIFGDGTTVFQDCTAHNVGGGTAVTAPNTGEAVPYGLVFLGGQLTAASSVKAGSMALGRNWGAYGAAAFIRTSLGPHISGVGWVKMGENTLETARFSEYETTGAGASTGSRAPQAKQLTDQQAASYTVEGIFGDWVPSFSR